MIWKQATKWGEENSRRLFLIDGMGALLSAFLLGVVLVELEETFGIPPAMLYLLALFPCFFAVYDFYSYQQKNHALGMYLQRIAWLNLGYCLLSVGLAIVHAEAISHLGEAYLAIEILIVCTLAILELRVAKRLIARSQRRAE